MLRKVLHLLLRVPIAHHSCLAPALCGNKETDSPIVIFEFLTNSTKNVPCNGSITNTHTYCNREK